MFTSDVAERRLFIQPGEKVKLMDNETKEVYEGICSSENHISISLKNVKGYGKKILVFNKKEFSVV